MLLHRRQEKNMIYDGKLHNYNELYPAERVNVVIKPVVKPFGLKRKIKSALYTKKSNKVDKV